MQGHNNARACIVLCSLGLATIGCATTSAPEGWLPSPEEAQQQAFGGWIEVSVRDASGRQTFAGELIAIDTNAVYVLTDSSFEIIAKSDVWKARLFSYSTNWGYLGAWTVLGTLATISHGVFLIISAPIWILGGSVATAGQSRVPMLKYPKHSWEALSAFARFPQGPPPDLKSKGMLLRRKR